MFSPNVFVKSSAPRMNNVSFRHLLQVTSSRRILAGGGYVEGGDGSTSCLTPLIQDHGPCRLLTICVPLDNR